MLRYKMTRSKFALNTAQDALTIIAHANRSLLVVEVRIGGMGTASADNDVTFAVSTGGAGGGGALTIVPDSSLYPAAGFTNFTTWTTQPTLGNVLDVFPVNANGAICYWKAAKLDDAYEIPGNTRASFRAQNGTSNVTMMVRVVEI